MVEQEKFLPIGTVCTIRGNNKKVMITGYFSVEYSGNIRMFDYSACDYPEGLLLSNKTCSFNHNDILSINYMGFLTEDHKRFNDLLNRQNHPDNKEEYTSSPILSNIQFDENGVVIFENISSKYSAEDSVISPILHENKIAIDNPFVPTAQINAEENSDLRKDSNEWSIFKNITYDENGIIVSAEENKREDLV